MSPVDTFAKRLQLLIDNKNITQTDVANGLGVDKARVSQWIAGTVKNPRRHTHVRLANFFNCSVDWIQNGKGEPFPKNEEISKITQEITGKGDNIALENIGQINNSSFAEKKKQYHTIDTDIVDNVVKKLRELKELKQWKADQEQRVTVQNFNLQMIVEWMDEQYAGENQAQTINHLQTMMDIFPSFKTFVEKKTNKK